MTEVGKLSVADQPPERIRRSISEIVDALDDGGALGVGVADKVKMLVTAYGCAMWEAGRDFRDESDGCGVSVSYAPPERR